MKKFRRKFVVVEEEEDEKKRKSLMFEKLTLSITKMIKQTQKLSFIISSVPDENFLC